MGSDTCPMDFCHMLLGGLIPRGWAHSGKEGKGRSYDKSMTVFEMSPELVHICGTVSLHVSGVPCWD